MARGSKITPLRVLPLAAAAAVFAAQAWAQNVQEQTPREETPATAEPQSTPNRTILGKIGRWVDDSIAEVTSGWRKTSSTVGDWTSQASAAAKDAAGVAKDAATSVVRIPATSMVSGRARCLQTSNGGPDCSVASDSLCRGKGYSGGTGLDIQSAQKCPAWVWLSGRPPAESECTMETYVTRAVCQ